MLEKHGVARFPDRCIGLIIDGFRPLARPARQSRDLKPPISAMKDQILLIEGPRLAPAQQPCQRLAMVTFRFDAMLFDQPLAQNRQKVAACEAVEILPNMKIGIVDSRC